MKNQARAFVIIAVLILVTGALLIVTAAAFMARAETRALAMEGRNAQSRALAGSALKALMSRLDDQREQMLEGGAPEIEDQLLLHDTGSGRAGVVRLLAADRQGRLLSPESARVDLNHADATALTVTGLVSADLAAAIIAHRDTTLARPLQSPLELLEVPGMTATILLGELESLSEDDVENSEAAPPPVLGDIVTVFAAEPDVQRDGKARINLNVDWSDELGNRIEKRFDRAAADLVKQLKLGGMKFEHPGALVEALAAINAPPAQWPAALDAFTTSADTHRYGMLDINHATVEALLSLPGLTPAQAGQIVQVRDGLTDEQRSSTAWLLTEEIVDAGQLAALADRITTRCWAWRVRLAVGEVAAEHPDEALENEIRYEAVIECSAGAARIAYLREITLLPYAMQLASGESEIAQMLALGNEAAEDEAESVSPIAVAEAGIEEDDVEEEAGTVAMGAAGEEPPPAASPQKPASGRKAGRWVAGGGG